LRMLGSSTWGGMLYISLLIGIIFYMAVNGLQLNKKNIKWIVWGGLIAGLVGSASAYKGWSSSAAEEAGLSATRLMWLLNLSYGLFPLVFALKFPRNKWVSILLMGICLVFIGLTGFRSRLVAFIMVYAGYGFFCAKNKKRFAVIAACLGLLLWGGIVVVSPVLPQGLQRAVSFVPGVQIDYMTGKNAQGSIDWRVEIWGYCLQQVPKYWLIGRGSAFNVWDTVAQLGHNDIKLFTPWFAFETRSYHSGPLTLLLDYGVPGLLIGIWLTIIVFRHFYKLSVRLAVLDTFESRFALFLTVYVLWQWAAFFLVYGAMATFATMLTSLAAALVVSNSVLGRHEGEKLEQSTNNTAQWNSAGRK